ncbi:restriction endonuclease [Pullulanibacillus sp. KACC 23026]|uniref:restriction endonuclease n=1 Tax=Pullulanibacillus sp. KACC 23026 TaxID=3028315 RepID=UPI0023AF62B2|nr:restriction endonuclease [Pullulanibacillus sp. KACC 23026]WEG11282.1 restriction endonuclease [Pullulanibacillus sp. KACC 23026]
MGIVLTVIILGGLFGFYYRRLRIDNENLKSVTTSLIETEEEMKLSLLLGVYHRYKKEVNSEKEENPLMFERFVARVLENYYSGETYVTRSSGDYGVDIEHERQDGLHLGQVKCYAPNQAVNYEPIAIIHSQMVKQNAGGGFVVTTSRFTENAVSYAKELQIELIDGMKLIEMWTEGTKTRYRPFLQDVQDIKANSNA